MTTGTEAADLSLEGLAADPRPFVLLASAPWCGHCQALAPRLRAAAESFGDRLTLLELDVGAHPEVARALSLHAVPTIMVRRDGRELFRRSGALDQPGIVALLNAAATGATEAPAGLRGVGEVDRRLRLLAGFGVVGVALATGGSRWLLAAGALLLFSALYDRCPLLLGLTARWRPARPRA